MNNIENNNEVITNKYEFMFYVQCINGNPNGDPDAGNMPRVDVETQRGFMTDGCIKRKIRDYVDTKYAEERNEGTMGIIMRSGTDINTTVAGIKEKVTDNIGAKDKNTVANARKKACEMYYDVRAFGGVLSTGLDAGKVTGPVQITYGLSVDPVMAQEMCITRVCDAVPETKNVKSYAEALEKEGKIEASKLQSIGRKAYIPYGLYEVRGFIAPNRAKDTNFTNKDLNVLFEAITKMYEMDKAAGRGQMDVVSPVVIFKHVGVDCGNEVERRNQCLIGCAPAHKLFEMVTCKRKSDVEVGRNYTDYDCYIDMSKKKAGVEVYLYNNELTAECERVESDEKVALW